MFNRKSEPKSLQPAQAALETYSKLEDAIRARVGELDPLIAERLSAERALRDAETEEALGEAKSGSVSAAKKRVDAGVAALDRQADKLHGLRARQAKLVPELIQGHQSLTEELPIHNSAIGEEFKIEWRKGMAEHSRLLSKRRAVEELCGMLELPGPTITSCQLDAELTAPRETLAGIGGAIKKLARAGKAASDAEGDPAPVPGVTVYTYHADKTYELVRPSQGLEVGAIVVEATFDPGRLASLVRAAWARPTRDRSVSQALWAAQRAATKMVEPPTEADRQRKAEEDEILKRRREEDIRNHPEWNWDDSMARPNPNEMSAAEYEAYKSMPLPEFRQWQKAHAPTGAAAPGSNRKVSAGPTAEFAAGRAEIERVIDKA